MVSLRSEASDGSWLGVPEVSKPPGPGGPVLLTKVLEHRSYGLGWMSLILVLAS